MNEDLKVCPFCGSNDIEEEFYEIGRKIKCNKCGCYGPTDIDNIKNIMWNTRHSPWISVKNEFPEENEIVLCFLKNYKFHVLKYDKKNNFTSIETGQVPINLVTHWQPLPQSPKEI